MDEASFVISQSVPTLLTQSTIRFMFACVCIHGRALGSVACRIMNTKQTRLHEYRSRVTGTGCLSRYPNELGLKFFKARLKIFLPQRHSSEGVKRI